MSPPYSSDDLAALQDEAFATKEPLHWVAPKDLDFSTPEGDPPAHEALADYWMTFLYLAERDHRAIDAAQGPLP